ncbi:hypothetical protein [Mesorhizobium onobrychidis]|uniref:hypothetical protein n=1 Tax=Mesorhizobium onobrychidis TaxID=2775404 RepID=UPI0021588570|nr:hypothetical protein [Mesorhizobium onobrychidis]
MDDIIHARSLLESLDLDRLAIEMVEGERRLADLGELLQQQLARRTRATDKLDAIGGDSAVARVSVVATGLRNNANVIQLSKGSPEPIDVP